MLYVLLAFGNGLLTVASRLLNASLGTRVGSLAGSFVNHGVGTLGAALLLLGGLGTGTMAGLGGIPWIYLTGGCFGVVVVAISNYAVRHVGAALFAILLLGGQLSTSAVIDHFGLLGTLRIAMTPGKMVGLVLILVGALLVLSETRARPPREAAADEASV